MSKLLHDEIEAAYRKRVRASVKASLRWIAYDFKKKNRLELLAQSTLTDAETVEILERQNYRCALTGLEFWSGSKGSFKPRSPSKDRIRADGPYTADNVRIVLYGVNALRGNGTDDEMYEVAAALLAQRKAISI